MPLSTSPSSTWLEAAPPCEAAESVLMDEPDYKYPIDVQLEPFTRKQRPQLSAQETLTHKIHQRHDIRNWCIVGVVLSILLSILAIVLGQLINSVPQPMPEFIEGYCIEKDTLFLNETVVAIYQPDHYLLPSNSAASILVVAFVNLGLTALLDVHGRVHTTALLWLLNRDSPDEPRYNANSRIFNGTKGFGPCHWSMNIIAALATSLCYGATSSVVTPITILFPCNKEVVVSGQTANAGYAIDFSGTALLILGFALLVQASISIWTLIEALGLRRFVIKTWSSDAVVNAIFLTAASSLPPSRTTTLTVEIPTYRQSLHRQIPKARVFVRIVWTILAVFLGAVGLTCYFAAKGGNFSSFGGEPWQRFGRVFNPISKGSLTTDYLAPLIQAACQGCLAVATHCADVVIKFRNDENSWQNAYTQYTKNPSKFTPRRFPVHMETWILFPMKAGVQTTFSFVLIVDAMFSVSLLPLIVTTALLFLIVLELEFFTRRTPTRGGPTTYGEFRVLNNYVSRYHPMWR